MENNINKKEINHNITNRKLNIPKIHADERAARKAAVEIAKREALERAKYLEKEGYEPYE